MTLPAPLHASRRTCILALLAAALLGGSLGYRIYTTRASYLLRQGQGALENERWDEADSWADALEVQGHPRHAHLLRGEAWVRKGRRLLTGGAPASPDRRSQALAAFRRALAALEHVQGEDPLGLDGTVLAAECRIHLGDSRQAAAALSAVVERQPDHKEAHRWLAAIYIDRNSPAEAIQHLRDWGRLDPSDGRPYRWIGFFHRGYGRPGEAIEAYREACRRSLKPGMLADVLQELAETLITGQGDYEAALQVLDQCSEASRGRADVAILRAQCLWGLGRLEEAVRLADTILQAEPSHFEALVLRARMHLAEDQPTAAVPLLVRAVQIDPQEPKGRQHLMEAYQQIGDDKRAKEQRRLLEETTASRTQLTRLQEAALAHPGDDGVRYDVAQLLLKLNRVAEAQQWLQAALACNPGNEQARQALARLVGNPSPQPRPPQLSKS
jgi:predicted Zn-dependent protease